MSTTMNCSNCGASSPAVQTMIVENCPRCGSDAVNVCHFERVDESVKLHESWTGILKDPSRPSREKERQRFKSGADFWRDKLRWVHLERFIDRDNARYFEKVTDPETGGVIHQCNEPLPEHRGHDSTADRRCGGSLPKGVDAVD